MVASFKQAVVLRMATGLGYFVSRIHDCVHTTADVQRARRFSLEQARQEHACVGPGWEIVEVLLHEGSVRSIGPAITSAQGDLPCRST